MHSARRQKGAKIIASLYDDDNDEDDQLQAPVPAKATFKSRAKKELKRPVKTSIHDEEDDDVVVKPKITLGKRRLFKPKPASTSLEQPQDDSIYTNEYIESLKAASTARSKPAEAPKRNVETTDAEMLDAPIEGITIADQDIVITEIITPDDDDSKADDDDDEYIPLDPETVAEERELLEAELYNEQDLEEGVGFQDEELALDRRQKNAQEDERRREMREAIDDYEDELQQIVPGDSLLPDGGRGGAVRDASAHANGAPGSGALGHPPLPSLTESLSRLRAQLASLAAQRAEKRAELEVLDAERARIADRQAELQTRMDQAGLDYQLARVALDARRPVDRVADD